MSTTSPGRDGIPPQTPAERPDCAVAARWAHLGMIATGLAGLLFVVPFFLLWIVPLAVRCASKDEFTRRSSTEALNFGVTQSVVGAVSWLVGLGLLAIPYLGVPVFDAVLTAQIGWGVTAVVLTVVGTVHANGGQPYRYPVAFAWPLVRRP